MNDLLGGIFEKVQTAYFEEIARFTQIPRSRPFDWLIEITSLAAR